MNIKQSTDIRSKSFLFNCLVAKYLSHDIGDGETFYGAVNQVAEICRKNGFDVFVQTPNKLVNKDYIALKREIKFQNILYIS